MKKILIMIMGAVTALCGCTSDPVKECGVEFAKALKAGDKQAAEAIYPGMAAFDSVVTNLDEKLIKVEKLDSVSKISFGDVQLLAVEKNGEVKIIDSYGLALLDPAVRKLYTGIVSTDSSARVIDSELLKMKKDAALTTFLCDLALKEVQSKVAVEKVEPNVSKNYNSNKATSNVVIKNNMEVDFDPADFEVNATITIKEYDEYFAKHPGQAIFGTFKIKTPVRFGDILPAGETYKFPATHDINAPESSFMNVPIKATLDIKPRISSEELLMKYYRPKGDEYKRFNEKE